MIRCILYPGAHLFSTAGGKEQAASILSEKVEDICSKIPAFRREIDWGRGKTSVGKDHCKYIFKNGSDFENVAARESSRGKRKHGGLIEECVGVDQQILQQILIPMMNVSRRCLDGTVQETEVLNQSQLYINFGQKFTKICRKFSYTLETKEVMYMCYIYKIENLINHKKYIGLTNNIARRRARHFTDLKNHRHDNKFLQKEFDIYGVENFSFSIEFQGEVSSNEISTKEQEYILLYDSYRNGYNQNEGGNFGPSNGGTKFTQSDIFNILSALEFMSRPGAVLAKMYDTTTTTISRIKLGISHSQYKEQYYKLPLQERKAIYQIFCDSTNFYEDKVNTTILKSKRRLTQEQVYLILLNEELKRPRTQLDLMNKFGIKSSNTIRCITTGHSYKDYALSYSKLTMDEKNKLVSLLRE